MAKGIPLKVIWRADKNDKWFCLLLEAVKIITYIKPSTVRLRGAISQEAPCLNYRTGNGNDSNCHEFRTTEVGST